jgi:hypothetical protein
MEEEMKQVMTPDHPYWDTFLRRLEGPEGCNFQGEYDDEDNLIPESVEWECAGGKDKSKASAILKTVQDIDVSASLAFFEQYGGYCDCEIVFNVETGYRSRNKKGNPSYVREAGTNGTG